MIIKLSTDCLKSDIPANILSQKQREVRRWPAFVNLIPSSRQSSCLRDSITLVDRLIDDRRIISGGHVGCWARRVHHCTYGPWCPRVSLPALHKLIKGAWNSLTSPSSPSSPSPIRTQYTRGGVFCVTFHQSPLRRHIYIYIYIYYVGVQFI